MKSPRIYRPGAFSCLEWLAGAGGFEPPATGFGDQYAQIYWIILDGISAAIRLGAHHPISPNAIQ